MNARFRHGRQRSERGASIVIVAMLLTGLLSMTAIAVDLGAAYTERRHDQNTVDAAVMSAAVESVLGGGVINDVVAEVRLKVDTTLARSVSADEWLACQDDEQLWYTTRDLQSGNPTIAPVTDCISFSPAFDLVRVKLPPQRVNTVFASALGFDPISTSAAAEAAIVNGAGTGAPPFVALSTATQGDFVCLRTSSNPQPQTLLDGNGPGRAPTAGIRADPCDNTVYDTSSENFGTLSPYRYLDGCTRQNADVEVAISLGIDHIMGYFPGGYQGSTDARTRVDGGAGCTVAFPNTFAIDTGFNAQGLRCALISLKNTTDCNDVDARFHQGPFVQSTHTFAGETMDNEAPWAFLRPAFDLHVGGAPAHCVVLAAYRASDVSLGPGLPSGTGSNVDDDGMYRHYTEPVNGEVIDLRAEGIAPADWDHSDRYDAFVRCLDDWQPGDPALFEVSIGLTPRFAFIPKVFESDLSKVSYVHIESFLPSYMYRLYQQNSGSGSLPCDPLDPRPSVPFAIHDAGQQHSCGADTANVDRLSSIILACGMVPDALCGKSADGQTSGQDIYEFRLSR